MVATFRFTCRLHLDLLRAQDRLRGRPELKTLRRIGRSDNGRRDRTRRRWFAPVDCRNILQDAIAKRARRRDCTLNLRQRRSWRAIGCRRSRTLLRSRLRKTIMKLVPHH